MNKANILLYHGVTDNKYPFGIENWSGKHIYVDVFEEQMKYISENKKVCTLRELSSMLQSEDPCPPDCVAVTFDDSFKNVRTVALPVLKKYNIPATFFVTTGMVDNDRLFWVDRLEHMINHHKHDFFYFRGTCYSTSYLPHRQEVLCKLKKQMKDLPPKERYEMLDELEGILGWKDASEVKNYKTLSWDEVADLDDPPMYEVGGHTVNHEILSYLTPEEAKYEIKSCLDVLEDKLGRKVSLFSYPEGQENHYNDTVISLLKDEGIAVCPSAIEGDNCDGEDPFHLKRNMVGFVGGRFPFEESNSTNTCEKKLVSSS